MTRGNRILATVALLGLLIPGLDAAARARSNTATEASPETAIIAGSAGVAGVRLTGLPGTIVTDENGQYSVEVPRGWTGTVVPEKVGFAFEPPQRAYSSLSKSYTDQDYMAEIVTFTISGDVRLAEVAMTGLPGEIVTDSSGKYAAKVPYGWTGVVTPVKIGYRFEGPARQYPPVVKDHSGQDYRPIMLTFIVSGTVGVAGVTIQGLPGNPVTDDRGSYEARVDYGWSGIVTPTKRGYAFEPSSRRYTRIARGQQEENYTARILTFTVSGNAGQPGVVLQGLPGNPVTDIDGRYSVSIEYGWYGRVKPSKPGCVFEPAERSYATITADLAQQDYTPKAVTFTISGSTGVPGVLVQGLPGNPVSDPQGNYKAQVEYGWSGIVTPQKAGYTFAPPVREYTAVTASQNDENYAAEPGMVTISDVLTFGGEPLQNVKLTADPGGYSVVTDRNGRYTIKVPYGWSGRLILFAEDAEDIGPFTNVTSDIVDGRVLLPPAERRMVTISNVIAFAGEPIQDVKVTANPGEFTAVTDAHGRYSIKVPYGWSGRLTMSKPGFAFESQTEYSNVTADIVDGKSVPEDWPVLPSRIPQASTPIPTSDVLVIPTREPAAKGIAETTEDMRVMLQILREKLSEPRMILGVLRDYGSFFGEDRKAEAFYLQGAAVVFLIQADFPRSFPTQEAGEGGAQKETIDPVWQRARQRLYSPAGSRGYGARAQSGQVQEMTFEQFRDELLRSLRHAANLRHVEPNELVILTIVAQDEDAGWSGRAVSGGSYSSGGWIMGGSGGFGGGSFGYGGGSSFSSSRSSSGDSASVPSGAAVLDAQGKPVMQEAAASTTVLTMQAKKADIDAFGKGDLDFEQFRQKVKSFTY